MSEAEVVDFPLLLCYGFAQLKRDLANTENPRFGSPENPRKSVANDAAVAH